MKLKLEKHILIHSPEVSENTKKWGVYCIPRLWRDISGKLVVRFNGEQDTQFIETAQRAPNLYFSSEDNGKTWTQELDGENHYDMRCFSGWDKVYLKCSDGKIRAIRGLTDRKPVKNAPLIKEFLCPNDNSRMGVYRQGDLCDDFFGCELLTYENETSEPLVTPINIDFPEREIYVNITAFDGSEETVIDQYIKPHVFAMPYVNSIFEIEEGVLGGLAYGQCPKVSERYCCEAYLLVSTDGGVTWKKRSVITPEAEKYPYGLVGDGGEMSITRSANGDLLCVTRTDLSCDHQSQGISCGMRLFISKDNGYTWSKGIEIADSSVTPHIKTLKNGMLVAGYGRPGVHIIYSLDNGESWSEPISIIGKTLSEEMAAGSDYMTCKYWDTQSYSNLFIEVLEDDTVLVLYNNQKYKDSDGLNHKAAFIAVLKPYED